MRHAFDDRQTVSFRTTTGNQTAKHSLASSCKSPVMTSASIDYFEFDEDAPSAPLMLASVLPESRFFACEDLRWSDCVEDAAECQPGNVVLYRIGEGEPNEVIAQALARGASGILTEQLLPCPLPQCVVGSIDLALAKISSAQHQAPDRKLLTVGVLGQSGKTSTCLLAATLTNALGMRTAYQCDLGCSDGVVNQTSTDFVPIGAPLIDWLAESGDSMSRLALIEIDEHAARDGHYDAMQFDVLIVTGKRELSEDFGPSGLHCLVERLAANGVVIAPEEDARTRSLLEDADCHHVSYGNSASSEFSAVILDQSGGMSTIMLSAGDTSAMMETPLCGTAMASNIAATVAFGALLGHSLQDIAKHLNALRSIPGRGQRLVDFGRATVVLETGGTAERVSGALRTAKATGVGGRVWCVLVIGNEQSEDDLAGFGRSIERHAHHCVVTSQVDQTGSFLKRAHHLLDGVKECAAMRLVADQNQAIEWAVQSAGPRDTVVVITNRREQTAHAARTQFQAIETLVESLREVSEPEQFAEQDSESGFPITLKLFP
ncbi:hypothetical protein NHH03_25655 [Stieleria sp. TO1_6]|uniref:glutamate ligase domain-containing protein n=1 Tax=Stieleria tagensis TaxID=2956795 RepID=UPI00209BB4CF|nr:hypothetical protein [Stieleria tagensis]MCO8125148.1 hypothetical protein [Stieleria tagensis]